MNTMKTRSISMRVWKMKKMTCMRCQDGQAHGTTQDLPHIAMRTVSARGCSLLVLVTVSWSQPIDPIDLVLALERRTTASIPCFSEEVALRVEAMKDHSGMKA